MIKCQYCGKFISKLQNLSKQWTHETKCEKSISHQLKSFRIDIEYNPDVYKAIRDMYY